jgi:hypothetical protein
VTPDLLLAIEASREPDAAKLFKDRLDKDADAWDIHLSLFPVVQRVLNPPFINPHLPKMYAINRHLVPYLKEDEIASLVKLEIVEYTKRPKLEKLPKTKLMRSRVSFKHVESAIGYRDWEKTTVMMASLHKQKGGEAFAHKLLLLGSGYLDQSLGHSISCTAFILSEMMVRKDQDPWPALATLADYFCNGHFHSTPPLRTSSAFFENNNLDPYVLKASSGSGIVNLHHTITIYAIERMKHLFTKQEYNHLISAWIDWMGDKDTEEALIQASKGRPAADYSRFYHFFSGRETKSFLSSVMGMISSKKGRQQLSRYLVRGVCDLYQGHYDPHFLNGLGSVLWVLSRNGNKPAIARNVLYQYVDYFFNGMKS